MKRIAIILLSMIPLFTFNACDERDDIQADVDGLNSRLDELASGLEALNTSINSFYDVAVLQGSIFITDYTMDEKGDYTLTLSEGDPLVIYGGMPAEDIPVLAIDADGYWTYTLDGVTSYLTVNGEQVSARPTDGRDGVVPEISVVDGRWCYTIGDGEPIMIEGNYGIASVDDIPAGVFADVTPSDNGKSLTFKLAGENGAEYIVALLGGLDMTFSTTDAPAEEVTETTVPAGGSVTLNATLTSVEEVVIDPTPLEVKLDETDSSATDGKHTLTVAAPSGLAAGSYTVYFQIFSAKSEGYRMIVPLKVTVSE